MFPVNLSMLPGHFGLLLQVNHCSKKEVTLTAEMFKMRVPVLFWEIRLLLHSGLRKIMFGM